MMKLLLINCSITTLLKCELIFDQLESEVSGHLRKAPEEEACFTTFVSITTM